MTLFVSFLLLTLSHEKSQSTFQSYDNELTDQVCGRDTIPGKVPFYASIERDHSIFYGEKCSGVLIANQWVLTTGHCIFSLVGPLRVVLGDAWNNKSNCRFMYPYADQEILNNNIALLELKETVQFTRSIQPICLSEPGEDETFYGRYGTLAVWERLNPTGRKLQPNMQSTTSPIIRHTDCEKSYAKVGFKKLNLTGNLNESFICAGYSRHVKDICFPKPGNSLMVNVENHWVLVGISINNLDCEKPGLPHIYRRVGFYLDWIKTIVR
uniref:Peptidase S1 domain-containing protein n=1 Tax=Tetranychus urticae TaxID=32264 RepID=T1L3C7_TETUR